MLYRIFDRTGDRAVLEAALNAYRAAREAWAVIAVRTKGVYMADITVGEARQLRGHWSDRLTDIDSDLAAIEAKLDSAKPPKPDGPIPHTITEALKRPNRPAPAGRHTAPATFQPGHPLAVEFAAEKDYDSVGLQYRRVNQAERWQSQPMQSDGRLWRAAIPAEYSQTPYPLQYYFELREAPDSATLYPGFGEHLTAQPYFVVRQRPS